MKERILNSIARLIADVIKYDNDRKDVKILWFIRRDTYLKIVVFCTLYVVMKAFFKVDAIWTLIGLSLGHLFFDLLLYIRNKYK